MRKLKTPRSLAEEHWVWLESVLGKIYKDAFIHGYKHGVERKYGNKKGS